jgi:hypothetical protein
MAKAKKAKQLTFSLPNKVGLLSDISAAIAEAKVNIVAICAYEMEDRGYFMVMTDGNARAKKAIARMGAEIKEEDVVAVEMSNKVGELEKVAKKIAGVGVDIRLAYGTSGTGKAGTLVFMTADDKKAIKVINI